MGQQVSELSAGRTTVERPSDTELLVNRMFDAPPHIVFKAWSQPELFRRWWVPKSTPATLLACDMDVRTGGTYRLEFGANGQSMAFFGKYLEVIPEKKIVWTNDEGHEEGGVTTVTFEERGGQTLVTYHERYPTKEAADEAAQGSAQGLPEQFSQLDELVAELSA